MQYKHFFNKNFLRLAALILMVPIISSWGRYGHEHINKAAVLNLPDSMQAFFYNHMDFMIQESSMPDVRRYYPGDKKEGPRHYINLENYGILDSLPVTNNEAYKKYNAEKLENGTLPWYIQDMMDKLTKSFKSKRKTEILIEAADLGHYIADAHTPLHTSANYDGQLTGQRGIHSLWESLIPEKFGSNYHYQVQKAAYIKDVNQEIWQIIHHTHILVDSVLLAEKEVRQQLGDDMYQKDSTGQVIKNKYNKPMYSDKYITLLNQKMNGMVEKQMMLSVQAVADFWYTAWENAGKPDLSTLDPAELTKDNRKQLKKELKLLQKGQLMYQ